MCDIASKICMFVIKYLSSLSYFVSETLAFSCKCQVPVWRYTENWAWDQEKNVYLMIRFNTDATLHIVLFKVSE